MNIEELKAKYLGDSEFSKIENQINHGKKNWAKAIGKKAANDLTANEKKISPVESALNGISNARDKLKAMVQKIQQKYSVNISEAAVDSVSVNDAVSIRRVANADPEDSHITVKFKDGKLHDYSFKSVKAAMDYIMQGNYKGAVVVGFPSRKVLAK